MKGNNKSKNASKRVVQVVVIIPTHLYKKWKYGLPAPVYSEKWRDLTWSRIGLKLSLHHLRKTSMGFKMVVPTPKSDIDQIIICPHQKYWTLKCRLNFKWLHVLAVSRTSFGVNPHSIVPWISRNSLLEAGAKSEG